MTTINRTEQLALLLSLLGEDATHAALQKVDPQTAEQVKLSLDDFKKHPPTTDEVEYVIDDFDKFFRFAMGQIQSDLQEEKDEVYDDGEPQILQIAEENFDVSLEPTKKFTTPQLTGNSVYDLNRLHPYQVAAALKEDSAATISLVIRNLATEHAAKTLEFLPDAVRPNVFLQLAQPCEVRPMVIDKILESTVNAAMKVDQRQPIEDSANQMVMLMRSLPKSVRVPMLDELMNTNEDLATQVKSELYQFEDLARLDDRDLQKVLGQSSTDSLVLALQNADESLIVRILNNMSKRARETLQEEMEFKTNAREEEIAIGRTAIAKVLGELEEAGTITLE